MNDRSSQLVPRSWRAIRSPWTPDDQLAHVLILRGAIIWSYSHIEQKLFDFAIRCSREPEYRDISETPPFTAASRIKFLRKVFNTPGPLTRFSGLGLAILDRFDGSRDIRNQMAHAEMTVIGVYPIRFDDIVVTDGGIIRHSTPYYEGDLERIARRASRLSKAVQRLHYTLFKDDVGGDIEVVSSGPDYPGATLSKLE